MPAVVHHVVLCEYVAVTQTMDPTDQTQLARNLTLPQAVFAFCWCR